MYRPAPGLVVIYGSRPEERLFCYFYRFLPPEERIGVVFGPVQKFEQSVIHPIIIRAMAAGPWKFRHPHWVPVWNINSWSDLRPISSNILDIVDYRIPAGHPYVSVSFLSAFRWPLPSVYPLHYILSNRRVLSLSLRPILSNRCDVFTLL